MKLHKENNYWNSVFQ